MCAIMRQKSSRATVLGRRHGYPCSDGARPPGRRCNNPGTTHALPDAVRVPREVHVGQNLDQFCTECRSVLQSGDPLPQALARISQALARLIADPAFVAATFTDDMPPGRRELYHDGE